MQQQQQQHPMLPLKTAGLEEFIDLVATCRSGFETYEAGTFELWLGVDHPELGDILGVKAGLDEILVFSQKGRSQ